MTGQQERYDWWTDTRQITLCMRLAEQGMALAASARGECPVHGGDGCLYTFVAAVDLELRPGGWKGKAA